VVHVELVPSLGPVVKLGLAHDAVCEVAQSVGSAGRPFNRSGRLNRARSVWRF
jgi:hypothetical protein